MELLRVDISAWTASFRQQMFISGVQLSHPVPPISTIYGLLSAAKGDYVSIQDTRIGYTFKSSAKTLDLERVYEGGQDGLSKTNVNRREFLFDIKMTLYLSNLDLKKALENPYYPLTLGRSSDLIQINKIQIVVCDKINKGEVNATLVPTNTRIDDGILVTLPIEMSIDKPRNLRKSESFFYIRSPSIIETNSESFYLDRIDNICFFLLT